MATRFDDSDFYIILYYIILFYNILFYFILFYFILFYFILFYFILFYFILFYVTEKWMCCIEQKPEREVSYAVGYVSQSGHDQ